MFGFENDEMADRGRIQRRLSRQDRFDNYREITAKFATPAEKTLCGHAIKAGDVIGWAPSRKHAAAAEGKSPVRCALCWAKWSAENREADMIERGEMANCM